MIKCNTLSVRNILNNISFKLNKGEITVILGKNGSGKTTLLRAVSGNLPYSGKAYIDGVELSSYTQKQLSRRIAVMPQSLPEPDVTLERLVSFGRHPYTSLTGKLSDVDKSIIASAIQEVELSAIARRNVTTLSGGERRLAYFAMMLAQSTPLMLCDEPTANLDAEHQKKILSLLCRQRSQGKTVVCVLHDINQATEIADRILVLDKGELIFDGKDLGDLPVSHFGLKKYLCADKTLYL